MEAYEDEYTKFESACIACMYMELQARCGEREDLTVRATLDEEARKSYTLLGMHKGYDSRKQRLYLDGEPLGFIPPDTTNLNLSRDHPLRDYEGVVKLKDSRVYHSPGDGYWFDLQPEIEDNRELVEKLKNREYPLRVDVPLVEEWHHFERQKTGVRTFCRKRSRVADLLIREEMSVSDFNALNLNDTFVPAEIAQVVDEIRVKHGLNDSQRHALEVTLRHHLTCIQGPPGTGKTEVAGAVAEALELLQRNTNRTPFLTILGAPTNQAVDNMETNVRKRKASVVRNGNVARRRAKLDAMESPACTKHWIQQIVGGSGESKLKHMQELLDNLRECQGFLSGTCNSFASSLLDIHDVIKVLWGIIDEIAVANQGDLLTMLAFLLENGAVVCIGDHKQLPPMTRSIEAQRRGHNRSILERFSRHPSMDKVMLIHQFRMHPNLLALFNFISYDGRILSAKSCNELLPRQDFQGNRRKAVTFLNNECEETARGHSYLNKGEAVMVIEEAKRLLLTGTVKGSDITILAAYLPQVRKLQELIKRQTDNKEVQQITVYSIDAYQGKENNVILLSTVRNNRRNSIGFLASKPRVTVAFSRARTCMIIFGNIRTLLSDDPEYLWVNFFKTIHVVNAVVAEYLDEARPACKRSASTASIERGEHDVKRFCNRDPNLQHRVRVSRRDTVTVLRKRFSKNCTNDGDLHRPCHTNMVEHTKLAITYAPVAKTFYESIRMEHLDLDRLRLDVKRAVRWYQRFLNLRNRVIESRAFATAIEFVHALPRGTPTKRGNPCKRPDWQKTADLEKFIYLTRKDWSHRGYAVCEGLSKNKDPTNAVYYLAFQGLLNNTEWSVSEGMQELRDCFLYQSLAGRQMQKYKTAEYVQDGILSRAGDYMESLLAICNPDESDAKELRRALSEACEQVDDTDWQYLCFHLDQLIGATCTISKVGSLLSQSTHAYFAREVSLQIFRKIPNLQPLDILERGVLENIVKEVHREMLMMREVRYDPEDDDNSL